MRPIRKTGKKGAANRISGNYVKSYYPVDFVSETSKPKYKRKYVIDSTEVAAECLANIRDKKQEHFVLLTLDGANQLIKNHVVTIGTLNSSLVHPREVFALALEDRAAAIIIAHNHPSGNLAISEQDRKVTDIIKNAGEIMNIPLVDHIIVTSEGHVSVIDC